MLLIFSKHVQKVSHIARNEIIPKRSRLKDPFMQQKYMFTLRRNHTLKDFETRPIGYWVARKKYNLALYSAKNVIL